MRSGGGIPFGSYELLKRLARGGMAEVFLARQRGPEGFDRLVALKRILPHLVESRDFVRMFLDEARLAARLSHPNVVHIYEFGKVDEHYFIAMEYVDGVHAGQLVRPEAGAPPLPHAVVARVGADACAGLHHAHQLTDADGRSLRIVHRDVSPPNLLVSFDGVVKLCDFGIAKAVSGSDETRPGVVKGKFAYMSPEQCSGRPLDGRSDVFSLGLVMWELLAGRVALPRDDMVEAMQIIRDGRLPRIETVRRDVPPLLAAALGRALAVNPARRPTAAELGLALEEFIKQSPARGTAMELGAWLRDRFPRNPTGPQPILATVAATVAATPASAPELDADLTAVDGEPLAVTPPVVSGRRRGLAVLAASAAASAAVVAILIVLGRAGDRAAPPDAAPRVALSGAPDPAVDAGRPGRDAGRPGRDAGRPARALIEVITQPAGALVTLDGAAHGERAPVQFQDLAAGEHTIAVALAGFQPLERTVAVRAGERRTLDLALAPATAPPAPPRRPTARPGRLSVRTQPWSNVYLGGRKLGTTPFADLELPAGTYTLLFRNPDRPSHRRRVVIRAGATSKLSFTLPD